MNGPKCTASGAGLPTRSIERMCKYQVPGMGLMLVSVLCGPRLIVLAGMDAGL